MKAADQLAKNVEELESAVSRLGVSVDRTLNQAKRTTKLTTISCALLIVVAAVYLAH